jgi:hypothetical protein
MRRFAGSAWLGVTAALLVTACGPRPAPVTPGVRRAAVQVTLLEGPPIPPRPKVAKVQSLSCARSIGEALDFYETRETLKVEAARYGGNVVGSTMCDEENPLPHPECWRFLRCTGEVYRIRPGERM